MRYFLVGAAILVVVLLFGWQCAPLDQSYRFTEPDAQYDVPMGISFSPHHVESLGLNPEDTLEALLDLGVRDVRLSAYWSEIEIAPGVYDFRRLDRMLTILERHGARVVLSVGMKGVRWPEFYLPSHIDPVDNDGIVHLTQEEKNALFSFIEAVVIRYKGSVAVWQVENEPLDRTGPKNLALSFSLLEEEVALVRTLDPGTPILLTVSATRGPREEWAKLFVLGDILGLNVYFKKETFTGFWGLVHVYNGTKTSPYDLAEWQTLARAVGKQLVIAELQAEPYEARHIQDIYGAGPTFSPERFVKGVAYARSVPLDAAYLWGAEWWYREYLLGNPEYWDIAREVFAH